MIIIYLGGIGSGKTLSAVKDIVKNKQSYPLTGFKLKHLKYHRLKFSDIIASERNKDNKLIPKDVNWEFWKKLRDEQKRFSIYLDEAHNLISARSSMSKRNRLMSKWISQIRKILYSSEHNHIHIISQTVRRLDVNFRELAHIFVSCRSITVKGKVIIKQTFFEGEDNYMMNRSCGKHVFIGNDYFKYYNTMEIDEMGDEAEYI